MYHHQVPPEWYDGNVFRKITSSKHCIGTAPPNDLRATNNYQIVTEENGCIIFLIDAVCTVSMIHTKTELTNSRISTNKID